MLVIGHRGAKGLAPENTLASFSKALEHKVDQIELDVRVTSDRVAILCHDEEMTMPDGSKLLIADSTYATLKEHKADLMTFQEAVSFIDRRVTILVEVKPGVPTQPVITIVQDYLTDGWSMTDFCFGSFNQQILRELHAALPDVPTTVIESWSGVRARIRARELNTKRLNMRSWWLWSGFIYGMHKAGYQITPYTMNSPKQAERWKKYGLYGVITDFPDLYEKSR